MFVIKKKQHPQIAQTHTTGELWDRLSKIGGKLLVKTLIQIENGTAPRIPQGNEFTVAPMLTKEMAKINWEEQTTAEIKNLVRGLNPIMGVYSMLDGKKIKFWKVADVTNSLSECMTEKENGEVLLSDSKKGLYIKTKDGIISVLEIQGENAKRMNINDFLRGNKIEVGKKFN